MKPAIRASVAVRQVTATPPDVRLAEKALAPTAVGTLSVKQTVTEPRLGVTAELVVLRNAL